MGLTNYLRNPNTPGNRRPVDEDEAQSWVPLTDRFRDLSGKLARIWALAIGHPDLDKLRRAAQFYEEVRVWMAKFDAREREANGAPVPDDVKRLLALLVASSTEAGDVIDIYAAAGMPKPSLTDLGPAFVQQTLDAENPHLAIEALRDLLLQEGTHATRGNLVRSQAFSQRLRDIMNKYTNEQLTSAEVIAELIAFARDVAAEARRGASFIPPLTHDELAFYDAIAANESALEVQGEEVLAQIARELLAAVRGDMKTDWSVRDDVRAKLRSTVKRLLVKYRYPPDKQPEAIRLVIEQVETMALRGGA
jgi:type I restriction enzyme R subunit